MFVPHEKQIGRHLHKDLSVDEKTMPHVYVIVSRIYGRLFLYLMKQQIGRHLHKHSSLDEKTMPRVYVIVSRI